MSDKKANDPKVVLVVEDEFFVREDAAWVLEDHGFRTLQAASAEQALDIIEHRGDISVVFADIHLAGKLDGVDLARIVAERHPRIAVVVTSGRARVLDEQADFIRQFIPKPYAPEVVARQIRILVEDNDEEDFDDGGPSERGSGSDRRGEGPLV